MACDIEPLEPAIWFDRIEKIANDELGSVERSLRHAMHLLQLAPRSLREVVRLALDENAFEALLEAEEFDTAARHLVAPPTALSIRDDAGEAVRAVISCPVLRRSIDGMGETVALAVLDAWTTCLLALRTELGAEVFRLENQPQRKAQSERRRQPS